MDKKLFSYCHAMEISCTSNNPLVLQLTVHASLNYTHTQKRLIKPSVSFSIELTNKYIINKIYWSMK